MSDLLKRVFIRARLDGKWESVSLQDLIDRNHSGEIWDWFNRRLLDGFGLEEGSLVNERTAENMVQFLDAVGMTVVKIKEPSDE